MTITPNQTLIMTRPRAASERFVAGLNGQALVGCHVIYSPLVEIEPTGVKPDVEHAAGVIFTSQNGVLYAPDGQGRTAHCVGQRTARQAKASGWQVRTTAPDAATLIAQMQASPQGGPLVHLCGQHRRGDIAQHLTQAGMPTTEQILYRQPLQPLSQEAHEAIAGEVRVILPLFSPRTAAHLGTQLRAASHTFAFAMSGAVAKALGSDGMFDKVRISPEPTSDAMTRGVEMWLSSDSLS